MNLPAHKKMLSAAAAASVLLLTAACGSSEDADASASAPTSAAPSEDAGAEAEAPAAAGSYVDGDYSGVGSYVIPGGNSSVKVDLTLMGDTITAVEVERRASGTSLQFQKKFVSGIADEVVGKNIDDLDVTKVAGSSLTSGGFNQAIDQIKDEARG